MNLSTLRLGSTVYESHAELFSYHLYSLCGLETVNPKPFAASNGPMTFGKPPCASLAKGFVWCLELRAQGLKV